MRYFTNISLRVLEPSRVASYIQYPRGKARPVYALNKVEVWSSAIAARGSYVRPESLLGLCAANVC